MKPSLAILMLGATALYAASEVPTATEPVAITPTGATRAIAGLQVTALADKTRAVPNDTITYTLVCRNLGPAPERGIVIETEVPAGLALVHDGLSVAPTAGDPGHLRWVVPAMAKDEQTAFSFRARLADAAPGDRLELAPTVKSAGMPHPRAGQPAATEVVGVPLLAVMAVPDVIIAGLPGRRPLIDVESAPGQRLVQRLEGLGVVSGYPDGSFRPQGEVTRAEATKMVVAVRQLAGLRDRCGVSVALSRPATVAVRLEDHQGKLVRLLADGWSLPAGQHQVIWDGRDDAGESLPIGVYRYRVQATDADGLQQELDGTIHIVTVVPVPDGLTTSFADVPESAWYHKYVAKAEQDGIVKGYPGGMFRPSEPIRRVENTVLVVRAAGLSAEAEAQMNAELGFADQQDIPRWAVGYVAVATDVNNTSGSKLLVGYADNRFLPDQNLNRAEAATILERLIDREAPTAVTASGLVAAGHQVKIDGRTVATGDNGRFRETLPLAAEQDVVVVEAK